MGWLLLLHLSHSFPVPYRTSPQWNFPLQVLSYLKQSIISSCSCGHREWKSDSFSAESFPVGNKPCLPIQITQHSLHNFHFCHQPWHWLWELFWARAPLIKFPNSSSRVAGGEWLNPSCCTSGHWLGRLKGNKIFQQFPLEAGHEEEMVVMRKQAGNHMVTGRKGDRRVFVPESFPDLHCSWCLSHQGLATSLLVL